MFQLMLEKGYRVVESLSSVLRCDGVEGKLKMEDDLLKFGSAAAPALEA